jgi:hypothetical protein
MQVGAPSGEIPLFFGCKTLKSMKQRVVRLVVDRGKRGA